MKKNIALICNSGFGTDGISMFVLNNHQFFSHDKAIYHLIYSYTRSDTQVIEAYVNDWCKNDDKSCFIHRKKGLIKFATKLKSYFEDNKIEVLHVHGSSAAVLAEMVVAKWAGVNKIIVHSHNTSSSHNTIHKILRPLVNVFADERLACGKLAGQWMYGKNKKFTVIPNCIDSEKFRFNDSTRKTYRKELGINDEEIVIGHVGRFNYIKNQSFLLELVKSLEKQQPNKFKLLLVGDGPMVDEVKDKCNSLELEDSVMILGNRKDVANLLMAMDVFCMPSLYEGFPIVSMETQASGLPTIISSNVSTEVKLTDLVSFLPIDRGVELWTDEVVKIVNNSRDRKSYADKIKDAGYDIRRSAKMLEDIYMDNPS